MISFNAAEYRQKALLGGSSLQTAIDYLEFAIRRAPIEQAIELKRLRHPYQVGRLEGQALMAAGFDMEKESMYSGYKDWLILMYHAMSDCVDRYWPELRGQYGGVEDFPIIVSSAA